MSSLQQEFEKYSTLAKSLKKRPNDDELGHLYGLYKQATVGDINIPQPSIFQYENRQKWNAWNEKKGMRSDVAKQSYIDYVKSLQSRY